MGNTTAQFPADLVTFTEKPLPEVFIFCAVYKTKVSIKRSIRRLKYIIKI